MPEGNFLWHLFAFQHCRKDAEMVSVLFPKSKSTMRKLTFITIPMLLFALRATNFAQGEGMNTGTLTVLVTSTLGTAVPVGNLSVYKKSERPVFASDIKTQRTI